MPKQRLLIVEDEAGIRQLLSRAFAPDYEVLLASDGPEGIGLAGQRQPHLILLDMRMPGLDGLDVLRRLKMDPATVGIPVLVLSAAGESGSLLDAQELGAVDYLVKPASIADIRQAIRKIIPVHIERQEDAP